jgi:hypothetical protein
MPMQAVASEPGLWRNDQWAPGSPGLMAVIVGVSTYDHLPGGRPDAQSKSGALIGGQLVSSALTAASLFHWLKDRCDIDGCALAEIRLLLSPTDLEPADKRWRGLKPGDYSTATYDACQMAVRRWAVAFGRMNPVARSLSRGLFFFSGHGLNNWQEPILLPSDYLDPSLGEPADDALSVTGLQKLVNQIGAAEAYLFLDACQNPAALQGGLKPTGRDPLPVKDNVFDMAPAFAAKFMACAPARQAYQFATLDPGSPTEPMKGLTFFGQALLEALETGAADVFPHQGDRILFRPGPLNMFLLQRIPALVKAANGPPRSEPQMLPFGGSLSHLDQAVVAARMLTGGAPGIAAPLLPPIAAFAPAPPVGQGPPPLDASLDFSPTAATSSPADAHSAGLPAAQGLSPAVVAASSLRDDQFTPVGPGATIAQMRSGGAAHAVFGHEYASNMWADGWVKLRWADTGEPIADEDVTVTGAQVSADASVFRVDLFVKGNDERGAWLEMAYPPAGYLGPTPGIGLQAFGLLIPSVYGEPMGVRLSLRFDPDDHRLVSLSARSAPRGDDDRGARLLRLAEIGSELLAGEVTAQLDTLQQIMVEKRQSPLEAMMAASLLLGAGRLGPLHDWTRNLSNWFGNVSDGAVLWAEHLRRLYEPTASEEPADATEAVSRQAQQAALGFTAQTARQERAAHLTRIAARGAPVLQPTAVMAESQLADFDRLIQEPGLGPDVILGLTQARRIMAGAAERLWSHTAWTSGLFAVYYGLEFGGDFQALIGGPRRQLLPGGLTVSTSFGLDEERPSSPPTDGGSG